MQTPAVQTALTALDLVQDGRFTELRELFASSRKDVLTAEMLKAAWEREIGPRGAVTSAGAPSTGPIPRSAPLDEATADGPVEDGPGHLRARRVHAPGDGEQGRPSHGPADLAARRREPLMPWEPPDYVKAGAFDEEEVTLETVPFAVPGTISVPRGAGMRSGVVLLAGSGPADRDETIWRNKPLKDIA